MEKNNNSNFKPYTSISISSLDKSDELLNDILSLEIEILPRKIDKPVIIYGAGSLGKMAKDFFKYLNIPFLYVVDKNALQCRANESWHNIQIVHPEEVNEADKKDCLLAICTVTTPLIELQDQLKKDGWNDTAFFYDISEAYRDQYPLSNGWFLGKINNKERESVKKVYSLLADDSSRAHYMQFLAWHKLRVELLFNGLEINNDNRFFIPEIINRLNNKEIFVDCGAHTGEVTKKFIGITSGKYDKIYAIEPDYNNFEILKMQFKNNPNVAVIRCALSNKNGEERFYQGFYFASKLSKNGKNLVKTATLDNLSIQATFIKMHLEGGELDALQGALSTIQKSRPMVSVTTYHNPDGVWETPLFLIDSLKNYDYYIRLHSWAGTGAVFYAIPKERM